MKAYIYKCEKNNTRYICSEFYNSKEHVMIYHEDGGIYQQYWDIGRVEYKSIKGNITDELPPEAVESVNDVGHLISHVWRPGLCLDIKKALDIDQGEMSRDKRELKILVEKLHDILLYIEPDGNCLCAYGHKIRELLILACTECENLWSSYIRYSGCTNDRLTTIDYVKLNDKLFLPEYKVKFISHPVQKDLFPFANWNSQNPTTSLNWYDGYNKTKHNKNQFFHYATLENCLNAIAANIIMFCVRYSPYMLNENDICSNLVKEFFSIELINPDLSSFYIPYLISVDIASGAFSGPKDSQFEKEWASDGFSL